MTRPPGPRRLRLWLPWLAALALLGCDGGAVQAPPQRTAPAAAQGAAAATAPAWTADGAARDTERTGRDLRADERRGGHTLERHVGKTDEELRARLRRERGISAASTYDDRATAERVVAETLRQARRRVERWTAREGRRPNLALDFDGDPAVVIGRSLRRGEAASEPCHDAVVVLKWDEAAGEYFVLTSYPEVRR